MKNQKVAHLLILFNGVYAITLLPYPFFLLMSLYTHTNNQSSDQVWLENITAGLLATYPIGVLASFVCWIFYHVCKFKWAIMTANLFLIWLVPLVTVVIISSNIS